MDNHSNNPNKLIYLSLMAIIFVSFFTFIALFLYEEGMCITIYGNRIAMNSLVGYYGDCTAEFLYNHFGYATYLINLFILITTIYLMICRYKNNKIDQSMGLLILGAVIGVISFCVLFNLLFADADQQGNITQIFIYYFEPKMGFIGVLLVLFFALLVSINFIFAWSWVGVFEKTGALIYFIYRKIIQFLTKINQLPKNKPLIADFKKEKKTNNFMGSPLSKVLKKDDKSQIIAPKISLTTKPKPIKADKEQDNFKHKNTYFMPNLNLLSDIENQVNQYSKEDLNKLANLIENKLLDFKVEVKVINIQPGPVVTRFEIALASGLKVAQIVNLSDDLARSLSLSSVRIVKNIPGKPYIGIEIPNQSRETVALKEILNSKVFKESRSPLVIALGKRINGSAKVVDLATMPHLLVAGTTGSGKSVAINAMLLSMLYKSNPDEVKFILIDPKMLELSIYSDIPHLITPVVTQIEKAFSALQWCVYEMNRRYSLMKDYSARNLNAFNVLIEKRNNEKNPILDENENRLEKLPYIVVFIDEFADLILVEGKKIENLVARLAGKARAAGIHLVIATQRPSVNVITGIIKANIPSRIAFQLPTYVDSKTILDDGGAEQLLGKGDMLYLAGGSGIFERIHGAFVSDGEVERVVKYWKQQAQAHYKQEITEFNTPDQNDNTEEKKEPQDKENNEQMYEQAVELVIKERRASISYVQRKLQIGYNRSANLIERMQQEGIVSSPAQNGNRSVLVNTVPNFSKKDDQ